MSAATWLRVCLVAYAAAACKPSPEAGVAAATSVKASAPAVTDAGAEDAGAEDAGDAGDSPLARYWRREWSIHRGSDVAFEARGKDRCEALPEQRPQGFVMILIRRGGEGGDWTHFGVTDASPCRFPWGMLWLPTPPAACEVVSPSRMDRLYGELRRLSLETIRTRRLEQVSPHRGGWAVAYRYADVECEVSDILDSEVFNEDRKRFDDAQDLVRGVYQEAEDAGRP